MHQWKAYEIAEKIAKSLIEAKCIDKHNETKARGIIQIIIEDNVTII